MGNTSYQFTNEKPSKSKSRKVSVDNYENFYAKWTANPNYIYQMLNQNPVLTRNIVQFFPQARNSHDDFIQMVFYLQKHGFHIQRSEYGKYNMSHTSLVDRFFMIIMKIPRYEQLSQIVLNRDQMQNLFLEVMKLFMPNPHKGFINKLLEFIQMKDVQQATAKDYSNCLRLHLPKMEKLLTQYYYNKFEGLQQNGYLLKNFTSDILFQDGVLLAMILDSLTSPEIKLMYEPSSFGSSFHILHKNIVGYTGPWLMIIEHYEKDAQGNKVSCRFGAYQNGPISDVNSYQGDAQGFIFTAEPKIKIYFPADNEGKNYFYLNNPKGSFRNEKSGLGFGGDEHKNNFKIWIDQNIDKSTLYNGHDKTYGFGSIAFPSTTQLNISRLEIWGLGTLEDQKNQEQYWESRHIEINRRRKVNKDQFMKGDPGLLFQNTFAYRDKIIGQPNKNQQDGPNSRKQSVKSNVSSQNPEIKSPQRLNSGGSFKQEQQQNILNSPTQKSPVQYIPVQNSPVQNSPVQNRNSPQQNTGGYTNGYPNNQIPPMQLNAQFQPPQFNNGQFQTQYQQPQVVKKPSDEEQVPSLYKKSVRRNSQVDQPQLFQYDPQIGKRRTTQNQLNLQKQY